MSGFFWNIRGLNKTNKHPVIREWIKKSSLQFGCILETRVRESKADRIASSIFRDWSMLSNYEYSRLGKIWVVWSPKVRVTPCFKSAQLITCSILMEGAQEDIICSFVYAANRAEERRVLWEDLKNHQDSPMIRNKPWIVMGDFNETLEIEEHSGYTNSPLVTPGMREFQEVIQYCSMLDMSFHGPKFTWTNKRDSELICKKLDRTLMNTKWLQSFPQSHCVFEAGGCSDHLRCRIQIETEVLRPKRPFKFVNSVVDSPEFLPMVEQFWADTPEIYSSTSAIFRLAKKLKELKPVLRNLSKAQVGDITRRTKEAFEKLCASQQKTLSTPSQANSAEENMLYERWVRLSGIEEKVLSQKAKLHWLEVGDGNNIHFHNAAKTREIRNTIREIQREDGTTAATQEDIKTEAVRYFNGFLATQVQDYQGISVEALKELLNFECEELDQNMLVQNVTADDIKEVIFKMARNKAPGPDGYTCEFYKAAWPIVGKEVVVAVTSFFEYGFLPKGVNSTILALIPKKDEAILFKDYRPISCCNVLYKVISKLLANRLKKVLPKFISPSQSAFVKDRLLMENVLLASELVKNYHKDSVSARCALKIDISKAFDTVQWPFLLGTLKALGFPVKFITWIEKCITLASFSVQVNGELAGYFNSRRGLRQGCSLSPYLFVICMQVLSRMLDQAAISRQFGFHPYCQGVKLTHLCFADDVLVFSDGKKRSVEGILEVFKRFAEFSGLNISMEKSTLYLAGVNETESNVIHEHFSFAAGSLPVRYLGLPLMTKQMTVADYAPLIEKIRKRITSWNARFLSFAGRLQLISSVIHSLTNFWISAFRLPRKCIHEIDSLCAAFLWSGPELNPKKAKVAWKDCILPKDEGGLGLKSIAEANKVASLKLFWKLTSSPSSLWVQWVTRYLIKKGSIWTVKENSTLDSWIWKKLLKYRDIAKGFSKSEVKKWCNNIFLV